MKIVVLAGGLNPERDVSLASGSLIANALMKNGHEVLLLDVYEGADADAGFKIGTDFKYSYKVKESEPDLEAVKARNGDRTELIGRNVLEICKNADIAFLGLHGSIGENGQLQAVFDNFGIKYTGTGYIGSLLAMDKDISKRIMLQSGIATADWILFEFGNTDIDSVEEKIGYPCVVKPCSCGSSVGVSIADNRNQLITALEFAKKYEDMIICEKKIDGREFSVGILKGEALPVIEIIPKQGFYDYKHKYQAGITTEITPAELPDAHTKRLQARAAAVHKALRLGGYSRIDFIYDEKADEFFCLEANTLPGMTPTSLLPQEALAAGISYEQLCEMICGC